jgi:hypothetical protein
MRHSAFLVNWKSHGDPFPEWRAGCLSSVHLAFKIRRLKIFDDADTDSLNIGAILVATPS